MGVEIGWMRQESCGRHEKSLILFPSHLFPLTDTCLPCFAVEGREVPDL